MWVPVQQFGLFTKPEKFRTSIWAKSPEAEAMTHTRVSDTGHASALAADREAGRVEGTLEGSRACGSRTMTYVQYSGTGTVWGKRRRLTAGAEVNGAVSNGAADVVADPEGQVVAVNQGDCGASVSAGRKQSSTNDFCVPS